MRGVWKWGALPLFLVACRGTTNPPPKAPELREVDQRFLLRLKDYDFPRNPKLLDRVVASPHGYFRFINQAFSEAVCQDYRMEIGRLPVVNLHGDAHLEQYAVTDLGRGLTDFDDSSTGPNYIDLLRLGVSLHLTCEIKSWSGGSDRAFDRFLQGYRRALTESSYRPPEPVAVARLRKSFRSDRGQYFEWIESLMHPVPSEESAALELALAPYFKRQRAKTKSSAFFSVKRIGRLRMGVGSALDRKYLLRVEGASSDPLDDEVLEVKEIRDLQGISCISGPKTNDPFRILVSQSRIAYAPYKFLGYVRFRGKMFWIHSWVHNYKEIDVLSSIRSEEELLEVAGDIGAQLGRGHPLQIAEPHGERLRSALLSDLQENERILKEGAQRLSRSIYRTWMTFRETVQRARE